MKKGKKILLARAADFDPLEAVCLRSVVVQIGAMKFSVRGVCRDGGKLVLRLDFSAKKTGDFRNGVIDRSGTQITENKAGPGLFLADLLALVDRNDNYDPFLTLTVSDIEANASRIVSAVRDDNTPGDGPGGLLWLRVAADPAKLTKAFCSEAEKITYRKHFGADAGHKLLDDHIDGGWAIFRQHPQQTEELIAVVDTEAMANAFIKLMEAADH